MIDGTERYTIIKWCSCPSGVHHHREGRRKNVRGRVYGSHLAIEKMGGKQSLYYWRAADFLFDTVPESILV